MRKSCLLLSFSFCLLPVFAQFKVTFIVWDASPITDDSISIDGPFRYGIVKAHGGELKVETAEGEGSVFIIQVPAT